MRGAIPPLPNTPSWGGASLSTGTTLLYFTLLYPLYMEAVFVRKLRTPHDASLISSYSCETRLLNYGSAS